MKRNTNLVTGAIILVAASLGTGYWIGTRDVPEHSAAVHAAQEANTGERNILYYRNPMGLPDTSPVPKKDPMGMDYIPVYEGEEPQGSEGQIQISTEKVQKLGVRTELAQMRVLHRVVRAAGRVEPDERRLYTISPKFDGYVERLHVNVTGQQVAKGQPLFEVYSPELVSAQREYALAMQGLESLTGSSEEAQRGMRQLAESSLQRLRNWDISPAQLKALSRSVEGRRTLTFHSPVSGIVTEKKAVQGMRFEAGESLYQIVDLSAVWVLADVFEQDIGFLKNGAKADVQVSAYPGERFDGAVSYVYPTLNAQTRTVPVRIELRNPKLQLKPGMYAQVELAAGANQEVLTVPKSAVIDSGMRALVLVQQGEGRFEPREVKLGARSDQYVEVLDGVHDQEPVVVAANFLIDAESNLKAAIGGFAHADHGQAPSDSGASASSKKGVGHRATGEVEGVDVTAGTVTVNHGAVDTLNWPPMTMDFEAANSALLQDLKPGQTVQFEFVERQPGEWVITQITPQGGDGAHAGH